jgi:hypothetical protein
VSKREKPLELFDAFDRSIERAFEKVGAKVACGICDRFVPPGCEGKFKAKDPHCLLNEIGLDTL